MRRAISYVNSGKFRVKTEAERLEHFICEHFEERIAAKLGNPQTDPTVTASPPWTAQCPPRTASLAIAAFKPSIAYGRSVTGSCGWL
jgi:Mn-dependent DtxR family transcriptional regulator